MRQKQSEQTIRKWGICREENGRGRNIRKENIVIYSLFKKSRTFLCKQAEALRVKSKVLILNDQSNVQSF